MRRKVLEMALLACAVALTAQEQTGWAQAPGSPALTIEDRMEAEGAEHGYALRNRRDGQPGWAYDGLRFTAYIAPDGSVTFARRGFPYRDLTDAYLRSRGEDPYALEKAEFLEATFQARLPLAINHQEQVMVLALAELDDRLEWIWTSPALTRAEKRQVFVALWEETSDTPGGDKARAIITAFMGERGLPDPARRAD
jgi:hypothetical protein